MARNGMMLTPLAFLTGGGLTMLLIILLLPQSGGISNQLIVSSVTGLFASALWWYGCLVSSRICRDIEAACEQLTGAISRGRSSMTDYSREIRGSIEKAVKINSSHLEGVIAQTGDAAEQIVTMLQSLDQTTTSLIAHMDQFAESTFASLNRSNEVLANNAVMVDTIERHLNRREADEIGIASCRERV